MNTVELVMEALLQLDLMVKNYTKSSSKAIDIYQAIDAQREEVIAAKVRLTRAQDDLLIADQLIGKNAEVRAANLRSMTQNEQEDLDAQEMKLRALNASLRDQMDDVEFGKLFMENQRAKLKLLGWMIQFDPNVGKTIAGMQDPGNELASSLDDILSEVISKLRGYRLYDAN